MATKPISTEAIEKGTGRSWDEWLVWLDGLGARDLPHKEIARRVREEGGATGWWAQSVTVAWEQHIGRRVPGQDHQGDYHVSVTKTFSGTMDEAIAAWGRLVDGMRAFNGMPIEKGPRTSATEKWRRWGVTLADGSRVTASANEKVPGKASLAISHERLTSQKDIERWRAVWKVFLETL